MDGKEYGEIHSYISPNIAYLEISHKHRRGRANSIIVRHGLSSKDTAVIGSREVNEVLL